MLSIFRPLTGNMNFTHIKVVRPCAMDINTWLFVICHIFCILEICRKSFPQNKFLALVPFILACMVPRIKIEFKAIQPCTQNDKSPGMPLSCVNNTLQQIIGGGDRRVWLSITLFQFYIPSVNTNINFQVFLFLDRVWHFRMLSFL